MIQLLFLLDYVTNMPSTILIKSKRLGPKKIDMLIDDGFTIVDVTSKSPEAKWRRFSPFYPHEEACLTALIHIHTHDHDDKKGGEGKKDIKLSKSVEGLWQGLKVFKHVGIDLTKFEITNMKNIKRSVRKNGPVVGHLYDGRLIGYVEARKLIYLPAYNKVLDKMKDELRDLMRFNKLVLIDYSTNEDIDDVTKPLSHASIIKQRLLDLSIS